MSNPIVEALEHGAAKLGKALGEDAGKAVKDLYHSAGHKLKKVAKDTAETDAKHARELDKILKSGEKDLPKTPRSESGRPGRARDEAGTGHPNDRTREDDAKCTNGTDPVDLATGKVFLSQTDIALPGVLPLRFTRRYESSTRIGRHTGPSWSSTIDQRLEIDSEEIVFVTETGMLLRYPVPEPGERILPRHGPRWPLMLISQGDWAVNDPTTGLTRYFRESPHAPGLALPDEIADRNGHRITFNYAAGTGLPCAIRHSGGSELRLTCDGQGRLTCLHLAGAAEDGTDQMLRSYGYDEAGDLTTVSDSGGAVTRFEYDTEHRMTAWVDSNDFRYEYTYDHRHRCVAQSGAEGHMANRFAYGEPDPETGHRVSTLTDGAGAVTRYVFNERLLAVAITDALGNTSYTDYDTNDHPRTITDVLGGTTHLVHDDDGHLVSVVRPDGSTTSAVYTDLGLPAEVTGADGRTFHQEYDSRGNRIAVTNPAGQTTRLGYDAQGHLTSITDPLGSVTRIQCDAAGLPLTVTDPLGAVTAFHRDGFGRTTAITDPLGRTTRYRWTPEGRLAFRFDPDSTEQSWTYDGEGNCTSHTDPLGQVTGFEYGPFDQLTARTDPGGTRYQFVHDTQLQLVEVVNPQGASWRYEYDEVGNLISETDFDARTQLYVHDAAGRLSSRTTALGRTIHFTYDALGRAATKNIDGELTTYTYDSAGRTTRIVAPDSELVYDYDEFGRVVTETVNGRTVAFGYDILGRRVSRTTPMGVVSTWTYDAAGQRTGLDASGRVMVFSHDALGRELSRTLGDITFASQFDALGRLADQRVTSATETIQHRTYTYRADGCLTGIDEHRNGARHFELDPAGRVTAVSARDWAETYAYDGAGNQTYADWPERHPAPEARGERTYTGTRVNNAGGIRYEYDRAGRTVLRQRTRLSRKPDTWRYTWDAQDRLIDCTTPDGTYWKYTYDPLGRRSSKQRLADDRQTVVERVDFTWDGAVLCEQTTDAGITLTWDHRGFVPLIQRERKQLSDAEVDERFFAVVTDLIGAPTELLDERGRTAARTRSTVWGSTAWSTGSTAYTPLRFPGQYFDQETELHYNYFRIYDPLTGRFLTPDPLGLEPAPNPASYVTNPFTWADPFGLSPETDHEWVDPADINFSQRSVSPHDYAERMRAGEWDWEREDAPLRVMEVDGQLISYDNRRLDAAREIGEPVTIQRVNPNDPYPASTTGLTWKDAFDRRRAKPENRDSNGVPVPPQGVSERPPHTYVAKKRRRKKGCGNQ
jgi:RHS repeat-associated protein